MPPPRRRVRVGGVRSGLQPHAPYSSGPLLYAAATERAERFDLPLCTHLSELREEEAFVARATGPLRELLEGQNKGIMSR